jgi:transcriptional regulator with XRE-family HTH domain
MMNETVRVQFGSEVRRRRESRGMTLEALAERSGMTPDDVGSIEMGEREPSLVAVLRLATGLDLMPAELFTAEPADPTDPTLPPSAEEAASLPEPEPPKSRSRRKSRL